MVVASRRIAVAVGLTLANFGPDAIEGVLVAQIDDIAISSDAPKPPRIFPSAADACSISEGMASISLARCQMAMVGQSRDCGGQVEEVPPRTLIAGA